MKVRVDEVFESTLASSLFDYHNTSSNGLVANTMISFSPTIRSKPSVFNDYVNSNFPLVSSDFLTANGAVFMGLVDRPMSGKVASVGLPDSMDDLQVR